MQFLSSAVALIFITAFGIAVAEPCQVNTEAGKQAVEELAKTIGERGIEYVRDIHLKMTVERSVELVQSTSLTIREPG